MKLFRNPGLRARFVYAKLPYRTTLGFGNGVATAVTNIFRLRGAWDPDYSGTGGQFPDGWRNLGAGTGTQGFYRQYRTLGCSMSLSFRPSSAATTGAASIQNIFGYLTGNSDSLSLALPLDEQDCRQYAQNCPRTSNGSIKWRWHQRNATGASATPSPIRIKFKKYWRLGGRTDKSRYPFGQSDIYTVATVPATNNRVGVAGAQSARTDSSIPFTANNLPIDEIYLKIFALAQSSDLVVEPLCKVEVEINMTYYVQFFDVIYQGPGDP